MNAARKLDFDLKIDAAPKPRDAAPRGANLDALLRLLSDPLSVEREDQVQAWISEFEPGVVAEAMDRMASEDGGLSVDLLASMSSVVARWYRDGARTSPDRLLQSLIGLASPQKPLMLRIAAIDALGVTETQNPAVREHLDVYLKDASPAVRSSAEDAIYNLYG